MSDPARLSISVQHANGSTTRWGWDEALAENMPLGLSFSTSIPGGFKDATFNLPRSLTREYLDESLFDVVTVYGPGNQVAWKGRVQQLPREQDQRQSVQVGCAGLSAVLKDAPLLTEVYVDCNPQSWVDATLARKAYIAGLGGRSWDKVTAQSGSQADGGLIWTVPDQTALSASERTELMYTAPPGVGIATMMYKGQRTGTWTNFEAPLLYYSPNPDLQAGGGSVALTLDNTLRTATIAAPSRFQMLRAFVSTGYTTPASSTSSLSQQYSQIALYGDHGLTLRGGSSSTKGVYEDGFFWAPNGEDTSTVWEVRLSEGAAMSLEGDSAAATYNGVIVSYTDTDGTARIAAPPGVTYADYTDGDLLSSDPNNPATLHGLTRYGQLQISTPLPNTNADGDVPAVQIGRMWLAEQALPQRRGSITLPALVRHPREGMVPSWRVRAGDWVRVTDRPGDVARRIVSTSYSDDNHQMTLDVGGLPPKIEALLEAVGVQAVGIA